MPAPKSEISAFTSAPEKFSWHNEDSFLSSKKLPIYAVADGVTMPPVLELLIPSESKIAADKFCEESVRYLEKNFKMLSPKIIKSAYTRANLSLKKLNTGRRHRLSACAALAAVKGRFIFGSRICDCGFAVLRDGNIIFKTPEFWSRLKPSQNKRYRVLDGNPIGLQHIDFYKLKYKAGDILALFTDGFENHFGKKEFIRLFQNKNMSVMEKNIKNCDEKLMKKNPEKFGLERTILMVKLA